MIPSVSPKPLVSPNPDLGGRGNKRGEELSEAPHSGQAVRARGGGGGGVCPRADWFSGEAPGH